MEAGARRALVVEAADIMYWSALWFGFSVSMVVYNKWLLHSWEGGFNFPLLISMVHMALKYLLSMVMVRCSATALPEIPRKIWWLSAVPVGCATALDVAASNASYLYVSVTFYTIVKSTSLIFTLLFSILYKLQPCSLSLFSAVIITGLGVALASMGDTEFSLIGFLLVLGSSAIGGFRWSLTQVLMKQIRCNLDAILTIYLISPASALSLVPMSIWLDGARFFDSKFVEPSLLPFTVLNIVCSGLFAFSMILVELELLRRTSSVTLGVISYVKQMLQIGLSVIVFHDVLTPLNVSGFLLTLLGMFMYSMIKYRAQQERNGVAGKSSNGANGIGGHATGEEEEGLFTFDDYGETLDDDDNDDPYGGSDFDDDRSLSGADFELLGTSHSTTLRKT